MTVRSNSKVASAARSPVAAGARGAGPAGDSPLAEESVQEWMRET